MSRRRKSRRDFLRESGQIAAGAIIAGAASGSLAQDAADAAAETPDIINFNPAMSYRRLGKTDLMLSEVSLGGHWKNRDGGRYWGDFGDEIVPEDVGANRTEVMSKCMDVGINYLDITTPAECLAYGVALKGRRESMIVGADNHLLCPRNAKNRTVEALRLDAETCIRQLGFDYLDIWRIQADMQGRHTDDELKLMIEAFSQLHDEGKVRFLGISSHTRGFLEHVMQTFPEFSMVIFPYTAGSKTEESSAGPGGADQTRSIFETVKQSDVGVVTIKPFAGGSLFRTKVDFPVVDMGSEEEHELARLTIGYILENGSITTTVPGMTTPHEVENNVRASSERQASLSGEGKQRLTEATDRMWAELPKDYEWLREWEYV
jgi:predicted aldo/keto reductase-like oxidoreductase